MSIVNSNKEHFGFYQVGDLKFYSKLEAAHANDSIGKPLRWNFNESVYSSYDWKVEPQQTLAELYRIRAQQIRDKYDYLVIWLSGGADSSTVMRSFIDNDIKIDEVASQVNYEATHDKYNFLNGEIFNVAGPMVEQAKLKQPWLKHTIVDLAQMTMDHFTKKETKFDWIYQMNGYLNPNNAAKQDVKLQTPHWREMINAGKRVCFIHGIDKPRVHRVKDHYYFNFMDLIDTAVSANLQTLNRPWEFDELFYWSPELPEIVIKQAHVVKNYLKHAEAKDLWTDYNASTSQTIINGQKYGLPLDTLHRLIYPGWYPVPYQIKASNLLFTPRDDWFFALPENDTAKYSWRVGLEEIWKKYPDKWKKDPNDIGKGLIYMSSKHYDLGI